MNWMDSVNVKDVVGDLTLASVVWKQTNNARRMDNNKRTFMALKTNNIRSYQQPFFQSMKELGQINLLIRILFLNAIKKRNKKKFEIILIGSIIRFLKFNNWLPRFRELLTKSINRGIYTTATKLRHFLFTNGNSSVSIRYIQIQLSLQKLYLQTSPKHKSEQ